MPSTIAVRVLVGVLELLGDRDDLVVHELPDRGEDLLLHLGQALGLRQAWHGSSSIGLRLLLASIPRAMGDLHAGATASPDRAGRRGGSAAPVSPTSPLPAAQ